MLGAGFNSLAQTVGTGRRHGDLGITEQRSVKDRLKESVVVPLLKRRILAERDGTGDGSSKEVVLGH